MSICPLVPEHGKTHPWNKPPRYYPYWCPNSEHGGNGLFITEAMIAEANAMSNDLLEVIPQILDGSMSEADAAAIIARRANVRVEDILPTLQMKVRLARNFAELKQSRQTAVYTPRAKGVSSEGDAGKVPPAKFMEVMLKAGLTKKQAAEAIGRSVSRVHELTVTQGGKQHLFDTFVQAVEAYGGQAGNGAGESDGSVKGD